MLGFWAFALYSATVAYSNLQIPNAGDAGIITQAVASTAHGNAPAFYESYDCMVKGRCSLLLVHPGFVLYAAVPFYALDPSVTTLFALQAAAVGLAAVPLYVLTRRLTGSAAKGLLVSGVFLVWAPTFPAHAFPCIWSRSSPSNCSPWWPCGSRAGIASPCSWPS